MSQLAVLVGGPAMGECVEVEEATTELTLGAFTYERTPQTMPYLGETRVIFAKRKPAYQRVPR